MFAPQQGPVTMQDPHSDDLAAVDRAMQAPQTEPYRTGAPQRSRIGPGIVSLGIGLGIGLFDAACFNDVFLSDDCGIETGLLFFGGFWVNVFGLGLAIGGLFDGSRRHGIAIAGLIVNAVVLLGVFASVIAFMVWGDL